MPDHVHVCAEIPPSINISEVMRNVKVSTSKWIKQNFSVGKNFEWQEGYGAFSVSPSNKNALIQYIKNQEQHHKKYDFREEFLLLLLQKHRKCCDEIKFKLLLDNFTEVCFNLINHNNRLG